MSANYEDLRTVKQLVNETPWLTEGMLRWHLFHRAANGLDRAVIKLPKTILIDRAEFARWVEGHRVAPIQ